jgi:hypothetical protein
LSNSFAIVLLHSLTLVGWSALSLLAMDVTARPNLSQYQQSQTTPTAAQILQISALRVKPPPPMPEQHHHPKPTKNKLNTTTAATTRYMFLMNFKPTTPTFSNF